MIDQYNYRAIEQHRRKEGMPSLSEYSECMKVLCLRTDRDLEKRIRVFERSCYDDPEAEKADYIDNYGRDCFRLYILFQGTGDEWKDDGSGIDGTYRFLCRFYRLAANVLSGDMRQSENKVGAEQKKSQDMNLVKIRRYLEAGKYHSAVSQFMTVTNDLYRDMASGIASREYLAGLIILLAPLCPDLSEELWHMSGNDKSVMSQSIVSEPADAELENADEVIHNVAVQIGKRTYAVLHLKESCPRDEACALGRAALGSRLDGKTVRKEVYIPGKIVNFSV